MQTQVTELPGSRTRIDVRIEPDAVRERLERTARQLGREMRVPGFRKGKVPPQLVIQRVGREAVLEEALRDSLPEWYERAILEAGITPVGDPQLDVGELPDDAEELSFSIEVAIRPQAKLGEYKGLEVGKPEPEVPDEAVEGELERLREGFATLNPMDRPADEGDIVLIDYAGTIGGEPFEGSEARDFMVELGAEGLLEELDQALRGRSAGDQLEVEVDFPEDHQPASVAGKRATFAVEVKEVREKQLPALDDDFASEASEYETLEELRDDIRGRIGRALEGRADAAFREAAVDAAAATAELEIPEDVIHARAHEMWERVERSLEARGANAESYLRLQGKTREEMISEAHGDAERALRREATLEAVADAEGIEVSDEELLEAIGPGDGGDDPRKLLGRLRESGRDAILREDVRLRKAAEVIADSAKPIPVEQAAAREKLWTPEKGREAEGEPGAEGRRGKPGEAKAGELWTPGA